MRRGCAVVVLALLAGTVTGCGVGGGVDGPVLTSGFGGGGGLDAQIKGTVVLGSGGYLPAEHLSSLPDDVVEAAQACAGTTGEVAVFNPGSEVTITSE